MKDPLKLRVVVAEDDFLVGAEVVRLVESLGCEVLAVARDGAQAVEFVRTLRPDLARFLLRTEGCRLTCRRPRHIAQRR